MQSLRQASTPVLPPTHAPHPSIYAVPNKSLLQSVQDTFSPPHIPHSSIIAKPPNSPLQSSTTFKKPIYGVPSGIQAISWDITWALYITSCPWIWLSE